MKPRRILVTDTATAHLRIERTWWLANRDRPEVFDDDLGEAFRVVASLPGAGTPYEVAGVPSARRIYLRRVGCHLYFRFDRETVVVLAFWGARRRRPPL